MPGDLVFFDWEQDGLTDHVGLVYGVDEKDNYLLTIEGNHSRTVGTYEYLLNDPRIMGYGILKYVEEPEDEETEEAGEPEKAEEPEEAEKSETVEKPEKTEEPEKAEEPERTEKAGEEKLTEGREPKPVQNDTEAQAAEQSGDQDTENRREPDEPLPPTGSELLKRVQRFDKSVAGIRVQVEADEGAFPENTYMSLAPIDGNYLKDALSDEVDGEILEIQAVDIVFVNEYGEELEPAIPIRVSITVQETQYSDRATDVIHIDDNGTPSVVPQLADEGTESNCEILFDASSFTPYAVVRRTGEPEFHALCRCAENRRACDACARSGPAKGGADDKRTGCDRAGNGEGNSGAGNSRAGNSGGGYRSHCCDRRKRIREQQPGCRASAFRKLRGTRPGEWGRAKLRSG